jgi:N-acetylglucosamine-6-phosphate deacetylase
VLVTDSTPAAAAAGDRYRMAGIELHRDGDRVLDPGGRLAGSSITLDEGVDRWARFTGVPFARAWAAASERPAALVGMPGGLRPGSPADLVLLDGDHRVERVMKEGVWVR